MSSRLSPSKHNRPSHLILMMMMTMMMMAEMSEEQAIKL
jgi:hypothetical protein